MTSEETPFQPESLSGEKRWCITQNIIDSKKVSQEKNWQRLSPKRQTMSPWRYIGGVILTRCHQVFLPMADEDEELHDVRWFRWFVNIWQSYRWSTCCCGTRNNPWILLQISCLFYERRLIIRIVTQHQFSVADPGFPRGGAKILLNIILTENCLKMKEFWLGGRGGTQ